MSDRLTQIQDCLDQLATQLFATLYYTSNFAAPAPIAGQPFQPGSKTEEPTSASTPGPESQADGSTARTGKPSQEQFAASLQELAQDLVVKEQQIEMLVTSLPGIDRGQAQQEARLRELNDEMQAVKKDLEDANERRQVLRGRVEQVIFKTRRV